MVGNSQTNSMCVCVRVRLSVCQSVFVCLCVYYV